MAKKIKKTIKKKVEKPREFFLSYRDLVNDDDDLRWGRKFLTSKDFFKERRHPSTDSLKLGIQLEILYTLRRIEKELKRNKTII